MLNSVAAGRRLAHRTAIFQVAGTLLATALVFLMWGPIFATGVAIGGLVVALGAWVAARVALGGGVASAGEAMTRLLLGTVVKLLVVPAALVVAVVAWKLPPVALLLGVLTAIVTQVVAVFGRR